jgi:hypothetical protein
MHTLFGGKEWSTYVSVDFFGDNGQQPLGERAWVKLPMKFSSQTGGINSH